jgi:hypothetical protein
MVAASEDKTTADISGGTLQYFPTLDGKAHGAFSDAFLRVLTGDLPADLDGDGTDLPTSEGRAKVQATGYRTATKSVEIRPGARTQVLVSLESAGSPDGGAGPVGPGLVGAWERWVTVGQGKSHWEFTVRADGTYEFSSTGVGATRHSGSFTTSGNNWLMKSDTINSNDGGTYNLPTADTIVMTGALGTGVWKRIGR